MKRVFVCLFLCTALLLSLGLCAHAEAKIDYVADTAQILSEDVRAALSDQAAQISAQYGCGVYVVTVDDYRSYVNGGIEDFSEAVYKTYELGEGDGKNGIVLALSMDDRDYDLCAYGDFANYAFTDYGKDQLAGTFLDNFRRNDWQGGFQDYIANCGSLLDMAARGEPLDYVAPEPVPAKRGIDPFESLLILLFPSLAAGGTVSGMARQMKTAVKQTGAYNYIGQGGAELTAKEDQFINRSVTRQVIRRQRMDDRPGSAHSGGTTVNSGGFSHHSGKF